MSTESTHCSPLSRLVHAVAAAAGTRALAVGVALGLTTGAEAQTTWFVDDDGGPGVDFTDIQSAVFVAQPGDLIQVSAGVYPGFVVRKSLRILGESGANVASSVQLLLVPGPLPMVLSGLGLQRLELTACAATVALIDLTLSDDLVVRSCPDVRASDLRSGTSGSQLDVRASRLELARSTLTGRAGARGAACGDAGQVGDTAIVHQDSTLHICLTELVGGRGGDAHTTGCISTCANVGGQGGDALNGALSRVVLTGDGATPIGGGAGGAGCPFGSSAGFSYVQVGGSVRSSGYAFMSGIGVVGVVHESPVRDPSLALEGVPRPGAMVDVTVRGRAGELVTLELGRAPVVVPRLDSAIEQLVTAGRTLALGALPSSGELRVSLQIPASWPRGTLFWMQASMTDTATSSQLSNSVALLVR